MGGGTSSPNPSNADSRSAAGGGRGGPGQPGRVPGPRGPGQRRPPVRGGGLSVLPWPADPPGRPLALLLPGITANALVWAGVAGGPGGEFAVVAPDLRGRAGSA